VGDEDEEAKRESNVNLGSDNFKSLLLAVTAVVDVLVDPPFEFPCPVAEAPGPVAAGFEFKTLDSILTPAAVRLRKKL
jgi:hypothetical protein